MNKILVNSDNLLENVLSIILSSVNMKNKLKKLQEKSEKLDKSQISFKYQMLTKVKLTISNKV